MSICEPASLSSVALGHLSFNSWSLEGTSASTSVTLWMAPGLLLSIDNSKSDILCLERQCARAGGSHCLFLVAEEVAANANRNSFSESKLQAVPEKKPQASSIGK